MIGRLVDEALAAGNGLVRLAGHDAEWRTAFDASADGFLRSFAGPILAIPFVLLQQAGLENGAGESPPLWSALLGHVLDFTLFPLVMAVAVRWLGVTAGYSLFIVTTNWASFWLNAILAAISGLALAGLGAPIVIAFAVVVTLSLSVFMAWRAAREALAGDVATSLLTVLLSVGCGTVAYSVAHFVGGLGTAPAA